MQPKVNEVKFPFFNSWEELENIAVSDDTYASVNLPSGKRSTLFKGQNLGFSIPDGATITGIELFIEGRAEGLGSAERIDDSFIGQRRRCNRNKSGTQGIAHRFGLVGKRRQHGFHLEIWICFGYVGINIDR